MRCLRRSLVAAAMIAQLLLGGAGSAQAGSGGYGQFVGSWHAHSFGLEVTPSGNTYAVYRIYVWCSAHRHFGCDNVIGNQIYDGGFWYAHLNAPGTVQVTGTIYAGAEAALMGTQIVLKRLPQDFMLLTFGPRFHRSQTTLCGPNVPVPTNKCGA